MLMKSPLNANVLARDLLYVELISATGLTEVGITLAHCQITGALFSVALSLASTAWKSILTFATALAELFAKVLRLDAGARVVAWSIWMIAWGKVVHVIRSRILLELNFTTVHRPKPVLLLLLPRRCEVLEAFHRWDIAGLLLRELIDLFTSFREHDLR